VWKEGGSMTQHTLQDVIDSCKGEVILSANQNRSNYESIRQYLADEQNRHEELIATREIVAKMIETDRVIQLQFYPRNPIGSYTVYHYSLDAAINEAFGILDGMK
jgi:hypothetical protein